MIKKLPPLIKFLVGFTLIVTVKMFFYSDDYRGELLIIGILSLFIIGSFWFWKGIPGLLQKMEFNVFNVIINELEGAKIDTDKSEFKDLIKHHNRFSLTTYEKQIVNSANRNYYSINLDGSTHLIIHYFNVQLAETGNCNFLKIITPNKGLNLNYNSFEYSIINKLHKGKITSRIKGENNL